MEDKSDRIGCLGILLEFMGIKLQGPPSATKELPYRKRDDFLSPAERSFYGVLQSAVGERAAIFAKVRVADLLFVPRGKGMVGYQNRINSKHVDFVLCEPNSIRPLAAVELDDASHDRPDRVSRDDFLDTAFAAAQLPLVRFSARRQYEIREIIEKIEPALNQAKNTRVLPASSNASTPPNCPKCNSPMVLKLAGKGPNKGSAFYGCGNYPTCRETVPAE